MSSWFSFTSNDAPSEETSSQISNLEATLSTLEGTVDGLKTIVLKLAKRQRFLQQQVDLLFDKEESADEYVPTVSYRFLIDTLSTHMTKTQFETNTTQTDITHFETHYGYKPKDKLDFAYCFLMTIARKALQEQHTSFNFVLNARNKLTSAAQQAFIVSKRVKTKSSNAWDDFLCDYQYNELVLE